MSVVFKERRGTKKTFFYARCLYNTTLTPFGMTCILSFSFLFAALEAYFVQTKTQQDSTKLIAEQTKNQGNATSTNPLILGHLHQLENSIGFKWQPL